MRFKKIHLVLLGPIRASEFRKPYLKSGNSSNTACSYNAEFVESLSTLMLENVSEGPHILPNRGEEGLNRGLPIALVGAAEAHRACDTR